MLKQKTKSTLCKYCSIIRAIKIIRYYNSLLYYSINNNN